MSPPFLSFRNTRPEIVCALGVAFEFARHLQAVKLADNYVFLEELFPCSSGGYWKSPLGSCSLIHARHQSRTSRAAWMYLGDGSLVISWPGR
jgi:hypothetical protein